MTATTTHNNNISKQKQKKMFAKHESHESIKRKFSGGLFAPSPAKTQKTNVETTGAPKIERESIAKQRQSLPIALAKQK